MEITKHDNKAEIERLEKQKASIEQTVRNLEGKKGKKGFDDDKLGKQTDGWKENIKAIDAQLDALKK